MVCLFPPDIPLDKLLVGHHSSPQNAIIANVLYKSGVLENWGRGISLMTDECRRVGIPGPEFHTDGSAVWVVFHYKPYESGQNRASTPQVADVVRVVNAKSLSVKEIMDALTLRDRKNFLNAYLNPSIESGFIEPLYPNQPNHPRQKYRLTELGKSWVKEK